MLAGNDFVNRKTSLSILAKVFQYSCMLLFRLFSPERSDMPLSKSESAQKKRKASLLSLARLLFACIQISSNQWHKTAAGSFEKERINLLRFPKKQIYSWASCNFLPNKRHFLRCVAHRPSRNIKPPLTSLLGLLSLADMLDCA